MRKTKLLVMAALMFISALCAVGNASAFWGKPTVNPFRTTVLVNNAPELHMLVVPVLGENLKPEDYWGDNAISYGDDNYEDNEKGYIDVYLFLGNDYRDITLDFYAGLLTPGDENRKFYYVEERYLHLYKFNPSGDFDVCTLAEWSRPSIFIPGTGYITGEKWEPVVPPSFKIYVPACNGIEPFYSGLDFPLRATTYPYSDPLNPVGYGFVKIGRFYLAHEGKTVFYESDTVPPGFYDEYGLYYGGTYRFYFVMSEHSDEGFNPDRILRAVEIEFCFHECDD